MAQETGKFYPTPADPGDWVCFSISIPNASEYRAAVLGQLTWLTDWRCWRHSQADYSDAPPVNREIAALFSQAVYTARFGDCMTCEQMIECIETSEAMREAIDALIASLMSDNSSATYNAVSSLAQEAARSVYGENLSTGRMTENLVGGTNPTCDKDVLYGQCLAFCVTVNRAITDGLQKVEAASNAGELGVAVAQLPLLNLVTRNVGITSVLELADKAIEFLSEGYIAAYDETKELQYACALFCACEDDCQITIERIFSTFHTIVSTHGTFPLFGNFFEWLAWFNSAVVTGGVVADVAFFAAAGALKTANFLFFGAADWVLDVQLQRAANNPDGDWVFCECPGCEYVDFTAGEHGFTAVYATYIASEGYQFGNTPGNPDYSNLVIAGDFGDNVTSVTLVFNTTPPGNDVGRGLRYLHSASFDYLDDSPVASDMLIPVSPTTDVGVGECGFIPVNGSTYYTQGSTLRLIGIEICRG